MSVTYSIKHKKSAALSAAIFLLELMHSPRLHSEERPAAKQAGMKLEVKEMNILCQDIGNSINLLINNQDDNKHVIKLTSNTNNQFNTSINKNSQVKLSFSKEQFPIKIVASSAAQTTTFIIDKHCHISS